MKLRKGWFKKAKRKWVKQRLYSFDWYSSPSTSICAWLEWRNGRNVRLSRGFCPDAEELEALDAVRAGGFWVARHICATTESHMHFHKRTLNDFQHQNNRFRQGLKCTANPSARNG